MIGVGFFFGVSNYKGLVTGGGTNPQAGDFPYYNTEPASYGDSRIITTGGTYTFNAQSSNSDIAAVYIDTTDKVILENCNIKGAGYLINNNPEKPINIEVVNCRGFVLPSTTPSGSYTIPRRFLSVDNYKSIIVHNCYMEGTAGIVFAVQYSGVTGEGVSIKYNQAKNIDGTCIRPDGSTTIEPVQFVQAQGFSDNSGTQEVPNVEVAYNYIVNLPNLSSVEDNMNFYNFRGTSASPVLIHHNYIKGAYPYPWNSNTYSGGGIMVESPGSDLGWESSNYVLEANFVVMSDNYTFAIAAGTNISMTDSYGICKGYLDSEDASRLGVSGNNIELKGYPSGHYAYDYYGLNATNNVAISNITTGVVGENALSMGYWRNDGELQNRSYNGSPIVTETTRTTLPDTITRLVEDNALDTWKTLVTGARIGVNGLLSV